MIDHVNKTLLNQVKIVNQKICDIVLDPDLFNFLLKLLKLIDINNHIINLIEKTLKIYVETNFTKEYI